MDLQSFTKGFEELEKETGIERKPRTEAEDLTFFMIVRMYDYDLKFREFIMASTELYAIAVKEELTDALLEAVKRPLGNAVK